MIDPRDTARAIKPFVDALCFMAGGLTMIGLTLHLLAALP